MAFRFLHTADWQLGKPFAGFAGDIGAKLREARFETVAGLAKLATEREVDAVLVAGDVFDSHLPNLKTLHGVVDAMRGFSGPWVLIPGNHDFAHAGDIWKRLADIAGSDNLHLALEPEPVPLGDGRAVILPAPLSRRHDADDPTAWMDDCETSSTACRIGLAHGSIRDFGETPAPNPIAPDRAKLANLDYLALGDWHGQKRIDDRTWYAGTPEIDSFVDNDPGRALIVTLEGPSAAPKVESIATSIFEWRNLFVEGVQGATDAIERVERRIAEYASPNRLVLALTLIGRIDLAGRADLARRIEHWQARLAHLRLSDKLLDEPSEADISALARGGGAVAACARKLMAEKDDPAAALALRHLFDLAIASDN